MDQVAHISSGSSWLSLVAETAGCGGATVSRIQLRCFESLDDFATIYLQVVDSRGRLVEAMRLAVSGADLQDGVSVDLGYELETVLGAELIAWVEPGIVPDSARLTQPPPSARRRIFDPLAPMDLTLSASISELGSFAA